MSEEILAQENEKPKKKRGRKPKADKPAGYFCEDEEAAFKAYVESTDQTFRDKIFREKLYPVLTKMIESIGRRYRLFTPSESFDETFCDTLSFLMTKVDNFDASKGYKAYSYCGTVCKHYLLSKRVQDMKRISNNVSYDDMFGGSKTDDRIEENDESTNVNNEIIQRTIDEIERIVSDESEQINENERSVGYALLELLKNWEDIFVRIETKKFNKTSVYFFIREYTMLSAKEVRDAMKRYKNLYFFTKQKVIED